MAETKHVRGEGHGPNTQWTWGGIDPGDTFQPLMIKGAGLLGASLAITGTFDGATAGFECSNDGENWFDVPENLNNELIAATEPARFEISCGALWVRPKQASGTASSLAFDLVVRG